MNSPHNHKFCVVAVECLGGVAATPNVDYNPTPNPTMLTFMIGVPTLCAVLEIPEDDTTEPNTRVFTVTATGGNGQIIVLFPSASVFISEDDCEFTIGVERCSPYV